MTNVRQVNSLERARCVRPPIIATLSCSRIVPDKFSSTLNRLIVPFIAAGLLKRNVQDNSLLVVKPGKLHIANIALKNKFWFT